jgi:hypothetical protein
VRPYHAAVDTTSARWPRPSETCPRRRRTSAPR